jgi:hypothetical protein
VTLLTEAELDRMRSVAAEALPGTAVIQSASWVSDGGGAGTTTFTASGTVACRIAPITTGRVKEGEVGDRMSPDAQWIVTLPAETAIDLDKRIATNGGTFDVLAIHAPRGYEITRRVEVDQR